jgi:hypothetical protein
LPRRKTLNQQIRSFNTLPKLTGLLSVERAILEPISSGEKDYKIILARTSAAADFEKLYSEGNLQAKCYALVGIHKLNAVRFKDLASPMRSSRKIVATMHGCIVSKEAFGDVIKQIESGRYAL